MAPFTKSQFIWMNGSMMPWHEAQIHVSAHGLQYGTGVFEGMRSYDTPEGPAIFRLDAHMHRLKASAEHYEINIPYSVEQLSEAALEVIRANGLENAYLRPLAFFDSYSFSVWPKDCPVTTAIIAVPGRAYLQGGPEHGVRVMISSARRRSSFSSSYTEPAAPAPGPRRRAGCRPDRRRVRRNTSSTKPTTASATRGDTSIGPLWAGGRPARALG